MQLSIAAPRSLSENLLQVAVYAQFENSHAAYLVGKLHSTSVGAQSRGVLGGVPKLSPGGPFLELRQPVSVPGGVPASASQALDFQAEEVAA